MPCGVSCGLNGADAGLIDLLVGLISGSGSQYPVCSINSCRLDRRGGDNTTVLRCVSPERTVGVFVCSRPHEEMGGEGWPHCCKEEKNGRGL